MAKASLIGLITQGPELQHSAKGEPYVRFSVSSQTAAFFGTYNVSRSMSTKSPVDGTSTPNMRR